MIRCYGVFRRTRIQCIRSVNLNLNLPDINKTRTVTPRDRYRYQLSAWQHGNSCCLQWTHTSRTLSSWNLLISVNLMSSLVKKSFRNPIRRTFGQSYWESAFILLVPTLIQQKEFFMKRFGLLQDFHLHIGNESSLIPIKSLRRLSPLTEKEMLGCFKNQYKSYQNPIDFLIEECVCVCACLYLTEQNCLRTICVLN